MSGWKGGVEPGECFFEFALTLEFQGWPEERAVETNVCYLRISDLKHCSLNMNSM